MRKLMLVAGGVMLFGGAFTGTALASSTAASCVTASTATYTHTFDGPAGTATITAAKPLCGGESQTFTMVSYTAPGKSFGNPQFGYDVTSATVTSTHPTVTLRVDVPGCYTQVDTIFGTDVIQSIVEGGPRYGMNKVGEAGAPGNRSSGAHAWHNGGSTTCSPKPAVTFSSACDGTLTADLGNGADANVDAVFSLEASLVRVAPGATKTLATHAATLTVKDNRFGKTVGHYAKPANCSVTHTSPSAPASLSPSSSVPAAPTASVPAPVPTSAPASAPASLPASVPASVPAPGAASPSEDLDHKTNHPVETVTEIPAGTGNGNGVANPSSPAAAVQLPPPATGSLPVTGSDAFTLAGAATFMLAFGAGLIVLSRRPRRGRHAA